MKGTFWDSMRLFALLFAGVVMMLFLKFPQSLFDWWPLWMTWFFGVLHTLSLLLDNKFLNDYEQTFGSLFGLSLGVLLVLLYLFFVSPPAA